MGIGQGVNQGKTATGMLERARSGLDYEPMRDNMLVTEETNMSWAQYSGNQVTLCRRDLYDNGLVRALTFSIEDLEKILDAAKKNRIKEATENVNLHAEQTSAALKYLEQLSPKQS